MGSQGTAVKKPSSKKSKPTVKVATPSASGSRTGKPDERGNFPGGDIKKSPYPNKNEPVSPFPKTGAGERVDLPAPKNTGDDIIQKSKDEMARIDAERIANEEAAKRKLAEDAAAAQAAAEKEQTDLLERQTARGRQKAKAIAEYGRSDTILTSPLGLPQGPSSKAKKTLLGM